MRVLVALLLLTVPMAGAEWGEYGADGWPVNVDGESVNPFPGYTAAEADAIIASVAAGDPLNRVGGNTVYPYWPLLTAEATRMANDHPDRVKLHTAGKSTLGLDLYMLEIADFARLGSGEGIPLEEREVVWVDGGTHSNEYSGVYFALAWAQYLVEEYESDETARWIVENRHTWIMPMVNADGSHAMGRLNANGVNINRNYPVIWDGEGHDATLNNRGPSPASEVETQVNIEWFNRTRPDYYASVHCCGNLWLYPYGEQGIDPVDNQTFSRICDEAFAEVRDDCGPIWSTIYPASGSSVDTAYEYAGIPAFGYEMSGRGAVLLWGQPVTNEAVRTQEHESWNGLLHAFLNVHLYGAHAIVTEANIVEEDGAPMLAVTIRNDGYGNLTRGVLRLSTTDGETSVPVDHVAANATTTVAVPLGEAQGLAELTLTYAKRIVATSNEGRVAVPLLFSDDPAAVAPADGFVVPGASSQDEELESPGPGLAAFVAIVAAAVLLARRKTMR
jgi:hypothetical protein